MPLDDRLREMYARSAVDSPDDVEPAAFDRVVSRTGRVRLRRRIGSVVACVAVLVAALTVAGPLAHLGPNQAPVDRPRPEPSTVSKVHHYAADAPPGWTVRLGTVAWQIGKDRGAPGVQDVYQSPAKPQIQVASQVIPAGMTRSQWYSQYLGPDAARPMPVCFGPPSSWAPVTVDGVTGGLFGRIQWCSFTQVIVIKDNRAYVINAVPDPAHITQEPFSETVLYAFLASMRLSG